MPTMLKSTGDPLLTRQEAELCSGKLRWGRGTRQPVLPTWAKTSMLLYFPSTGHDNQSGIFLFVEFFFGFPIFELVHVYAERKLREKWNYRDPKERGKQDRHRTICRVFSLLIVYLWRLHEASSRGRLPSSLMMHRHHPSYVSRGDSILAVLYTSYRPFSTAASFSFSSQFCFKREIFRGATTGGQGLPTWEYNRYPSFYRIMKHESLRYVRVNLD